MGQQCCPCLEKEDKKKEEIISKSEQEIKRLKKQNQQVKEELRNLKQQLKNSKIKEQEYNRAQYALDQKMKSLNRKQQQMSKRPVQFANPNQFSPHNSAQGNQFLPQENQILKDKVRELQNKVRQKQQQILEKQLNIKRNSGRNNNLRNSNNDGGDKISRFEKYFTGEVLDEENDYKEFLANLVEREFGRRIKRTKLLFRHEKRTNRNLHPFVDGRAPFVLVVKTAEDYCFAGLSEGAISAQSLERGRGWLISLSNQRAFASIPGKFAVQHDNVYLIFGNQQIRVAGNSDVVFSNFGISNAYYDTRGKVQEFLGPGASDNFREAELKSFEVFEIVFE